MVKVYEIPKKLLIFIIIIMTYFGLYSCATYQSSNRIEMDGVYYNPKKDYNFSNKKNKIAHQENNTIKVGEPYFDANGNGAEDIFYKNKNDSNNPVDSLNYQLGSFPYNQKIDSRNTRVNVYVNNFVNPFWGIRNPYNSFYGYYGSSWGYGLNFNWGWGNFPYNNYFDPFWNNAWAINPYYYNNYRGWNRYNPFWSRQSYYYGNYYGGFYDPYWVYPNYYNIGYYNHSNYAKRPNYAPSGSRPTAGATVLRQSNFNNNINNGRVSRSLNDSRQESPNSNNQNNIRYRTPNTNNQKSERISRDNAFNVRHSRPIYSDRNVNNNDKSQRQNTQQSPSRSYDIRPTQNQSNTPSRPVSPSQYPSGRINTGRK